MAGRFEIAGRRILTRAVARLLPPREEPPAELLLEPPERVLVVRHDDRIGNLVLLTPMLDGIREVWPEVKPDVLVGPRFARVYAEEAGIGHVWILEKRRILRNPIRFLSLIRKIRRQRYDLTFDASHMHSFSLTGASLVYFSGAPVRVAYDRGEASAFANLLIEPLRAEHHESDLLLNLLRPFTETVPQPPLRLSVSEAERRAAVRSLRGRGIDPARVLVGMHVGGRDAKRWPIERYVKLLEHIQERYKVALVVLCGPAERAEAARLRDRFGSAVTVLEDLEIRELMALIEQCDLFISPDTGAMHLAVALDVPTTAIFLQDTWRRYGPQGIRHRIVRVDAEGGEEIVLTAFAELVSMVFGEGSAADHDDAHS